jgi:RecA-family ATPase
MPSQPQRHLLVDAVSFAAKRSEQIDWIVEGVLERGANGFIVANPKVGKSFAAIDLAVSLTLGVPWLEFKIPAPVKTALISREDNPALTAWRLKHIFLGKQCTSPDLLTNLYVNSREQSAELLLDNPEQMDAMSAELKRRSTEFVIFDVFNVLHNCDENDAGEMRRVMLRLSQLQSEVGCAIGVIHHFTKGTDGMSLTQRLRGSSAISGWCEWLIGITMAEQETKTRKMEFEIKAASAPDPIYFNIVSAESVRLERNTCYVTNQPAQKAGSKYMQ